MNASAPPVPPRPPSSPGPSALVATLPTPDGPFTVIAADDAVLASGWTDDVDALLTLVHPSLRPDREQVEAAGDASSSSGPGVLARALRAVGEYYGGDPAAPAAVPVLQVSGPFRQRAWEVLRRVGPGEPVTYTELAARCGRPTAVRAAAGACAFNAAALFVPCHRVLRSDGSLGGFRWGARLKEGLLAREAADAVGQPPASP